MCDTCGCGEPESKYTITDPEESDNSGHSHVHDHEDHEHGHGDEDDHNHSHSHSHDHNRKIEVEQDILSKNNLLAERNRGYFEARNILALNLVSSPGSGKTTILEKTINDLQNNLNFSVIEGDQQSMNDANRIKSTGAPVVQINTGSGCHLDAEMINNSIKKLKIIDNSILMIENVGNLVCPALFDLGENFRIVIISITEGEDKPLKYPYMFRSSDLCIINKTDLLPYVEFNTDKTREYALRVNHHLQFIELSAKTGEGMEKWYDWLEDKVKPAHL